MSLSVTKSSPREEKVASDNHLVHIDGGGPDYWEEEVLSKPKRCCCCCASSTSCAFSCFREIPLGLACIYTFLALLLSLGRRCMLSCFCCCFKSSTWTNDVLALTDENLDSLMIDTYPFSHFTKENNIIDMQDISSVQMLTGQHLVGASAILKNEKLDSILVYKQKETLRIDKNNPLWESAKIHLQQSLFYWITFVLHPHVHFKIDAVIAIINNHIKDDKHPLRILLAPAFEFTHDVNYSVLQGVNSVLRGESNACCLWDVQPCSRKEIQKLINLSGTQKIKLQSDKLENANFYPKSRKELSTFVQLVLTHCKTSHSDDKSVDYDKLLYDLQTMYEDTAKNLHELFTELIWNVSVIHSLQHHTLAQWNVVYQPINISKSPFYDSETSEFPEVTMKNRLKQEFYHNMFVQWWNNYLCHDSRLGKTKYEFSCDSLNKAATVFKETLKEEVPSGIYDRIAKSIEW